MGSLRLDGEQTITSQDVAFANPGEMGDGLSFAPDAKLGDGLLEGCIIHQFKPLDSSA